MNILFLEYQADRYDKVKRILSDYEGFVLERAISVEDAIDKCNDAETKYDLVLIDLDSKNTDHTAILNWIQEASSNISFLVLTSCDQCVHDDRLAQARVDYSIGFFKKPSYNLMVHFISTKLTHVNLRRMAQMVAELHRISERLNTMYNSLEEGKS